MSHHFKILKSAGLTRCWNRNDGCHWPPPRKSFLTGLAAAFVYVCEEINQFVREEGILQLQTDLDSVVVRFDYLLPQIFVALTNRNASLAIYVIRSKLLETMSNVTFFTCNCHKSLIMTQENCNCIYLSSISASFEGSWLRDFTISLLPVHCL